MLLIIAVMISGSLLVPTTPFTIGNFLKDGLKGTWNPAPPTGATLFFCSEEPPTFYRDLFRSNFMVKIATPPHWFHTLNIVQRPSPLKLHTLVVDRQCPMADQLLRKATELGLIRHYYRWLILNVTQEETTQESCKDLAAEISANGSSIAEGKLADSDVVLVCRGEKSLLLVDLWGPIEPTILGKWIPDLENRFPGNRPPPAVRRSAAGLNGYLFRPVFVIEHKDTFKHFNDGVNKQHDFYSKFNYEVIHLAVEMLNGSIQLVFGKDYGFKINGTWTGSIGMMLRHEAELGGTPNAILHSRLPYLTYLNYHMPATGAFIFREPPVSSVYNIFTQPFPMSLWLASAGLLTLGAILLYTVLRVEETISEVDERIDGLQIADGKKPGLDASWSDVALLSIGAVCQQGAPDEARSAAGRIVTLCLLLWILFISISFTASIVALLQSTTSNIHHYKDFLGSKISLGIENVSYLIYYTSTESETYRRRIYVEKLTRRGKRNPFMSLEEGVKKIQTSYFAFLAPRPSIYQMISDTFLEHEKCGLREVDNFCIVANPQMTVAKWSPHTEVIRIALRKIQERGFHHRQRHKFIAGKPVCTNLGANFQSVSLTDCYGAFVVLCAGLGVSIFVLFIEKFVYPRVARLKANCQCLHKVM